MADIGTIKGRAELDTSGFTKGLTAATGGLGSFSKQMAATTLGMVGAGSIQAVLSKVTQGVKASVQSFVNFEAKMAEVSTLVDTSKTNMSELERGVVNLSKKYGEDADGLATALYQTISAGIDAADSIKFLDAATKAAIGGVTDTETAVNALTSVINAYGMSADDVSEVSDSLFTTIKLGKTTMAELSGVIGRVAPIAASAGVKLDEMNNALATMTLAGLSTDEAGTSVRAMLVSLIKPTDQAMKAAEALNIELGVKGIKAAGGFAEYMSELREKTGGSTEALAELFPNVRALNGVLTLTGGGFEKLNNNIDEYNDKLGAAETATNKMLETSKVTWGQIGQQLKEWGRSVGEHVLEPLGKVIKLHRDLEEAKMKGPGVHYNELMKKENKSREEWYELLVEIKAKEIELTELRDKTEGQNEGFTKNVEARIANEQKKFKIAKNYYDLKVSEEAMESDKAKAQAERDKVEQERMRKRQKEAEERLKKLKKDQEDEEKKDKEKANRVKELAELEVEVAEETHKVRVGNINAEIEALDELAESDKLSENEKLEYKLLASWKRKDLADSEKEHALRMLSILKEQKVKDAKGDQEMLNKIEEWYKTASHSIAEDWKQRVAKELKIEAEITGDINKNLWENWKKEVHESFELWKKELKSGSTKAWGDLVKNGTNEILAIGDAFGILSEEASMNIQNFGNVITATLTGGPVAGALAGLKAIGSAITSAGEKSKEAAKQERDAAEAAKTAGRAFLKAAGKEDVRTMSITEIGEFMEGIKGDQARMVAVGGRDAMESSEYKQLQKMWEDALETVVARRLELGQMTPEQAAAAGFTGVTATNVYSQALSPFEAKSWDQARSIVEKMLDDEKIDETVYKNWLKALATKFINEVRPQDYIDIMAMAKGGIVTAPTIAMLGENNKKEAVIPLEDTNRLKEIFGGIGGTLDVNVNVTGDTDSAQEVGEVVGDRVETLLKSKGF